MGGYPSPSALTSWAQSHGMTSVPALGMDSSTESLYWHFDSDAYMPSYVILDRDMTVLAAEAGSPNPGSYL